MTVQPPTNIATRADCVTCYTDAAWRASDGATGCGWIFQRSGNQDTRQGSSYFTNIRSPLLGEALAMRLALSHALSLGINRVCVYSDCQLLVRAISSKSPPVEFYGITRDIETLSLQFEPFCLFYISRTLNKSADLLEKSALCNVSPLV
ncbi:hypothetical protein Bca4012_036909 [Brassica carinata]